MLFFGRVFFNQIDLGVYNKKIYIGITLNSYTVNDVVEVYNRKIQQIGCCIRFKMII